MKINLLALALLTTINVYGQTKKISHFDFKIAKKEVYYVLKSDKSFREGEYKAFRSDASASALLVEGYYHNNKKDSTWKYYSGGQLVAQGNYTNGEKTGTWAGYTRGFERLKYDFDKQELLTYIPNPLDTAQWNGIITAANPDVVLDRLPIYINGMAAFNRSAQWSIRYPAAAREARKQGEVMVTFTIDEKGKPGNYRVKTKLGYELEATALNAIKNIDGEWLPGTIKGKPVPVQCEISVLFAISSGEDIIAKPNQIVILVMGVTALK
jgi:TonB family protein